MSRIVRVTRPEAERRLRDVPQEQAFWCCDGQVLRNLAELQAALSNMSEVTFAYHSDSNSGRSDFSNWVRDVIGDDKLSRDLLKSKDPAQAARRVGARVAFLRSKLVAM